MEHVTCYFIDLYAAYELYIIYMTYTRCYLPTQRVCTVRAQEPDPRQVIRLRMHSVQQRHRRCVTSEPRVGVYIVFSTTWLSYWQPVRFKLNI